MRADDALDDLDDDEDQDDEQCQRQKPKRRHCWVWTQVGAYTLIACGHCPKVKAEWVSLDGDSARISASAENHAERCVRLSPWLVIPAQRMPSSTRGSAVRAGLLPNIPGR